MRVYSCHGFAFDDADGGVVYFRTKRDALHAAREQTAPGEGDETGSEATVEVHYILKPLNAERMVDLLNRERWCAKTEFVAKVENGRVTEKADG